MSNLDGIAVRVIRHGRPVSAFVGELQYLTELELATMPSYLSIPIRDAMQSSNEWSHSMTRRAWVNAARDGQ